jgi:ribosomal protein S18 acetylase RimI-like enzyme
MTSFTIDTYEAHHRPWAESILRRNWGSVQMVTRGRLYPVLDYPGFVGLVEGQPQALVTYRLEGAACEILILHSAAAGLGIGSALIERVCQQAQAAGCHRLWLITTNDNIHAIRWYQRRGFTLAAAHVNALAESRKLKPEIPLVGNDGIPLRDEIEFEMLLA